MNAELSPMARIIWLSFVLFAAGFGGYYGIAEMCWRHVEAGGLRSIIGLAGILVNVALLWVAPFWIFGAMIIGAFRELKETNSKKK